MNILVDLTACPKDTSLSVYAFRVLKVLGNIKRPNDRISLLVRQELEDKVKEELPEYNYSVFRGFTYKNRFQRLFKMKVIYDCFIWVRTINRENCDVVYLPSYDIITSWKVKKIKIQTVHDIERIRVSAGETRWIWINKIYTPFMLYNANKIIAITEYVKQDIIKTYRFPEKNKIEVIYNPVSVDSKLTLSSSHLQIDYKYLLYVSTLTKYKNIITLINAFIDIKDQIPHNLVIVGKKTPYWESVVLPIVKANHLENRVIHFFDYVSNEKLISLYKSADILISPSLREGFGYTPIEAAIYGTPVICTKETALYESTMGLVNYYEPSLDHIQLKNKIMDVLENYPSKQQLKIIAETFKAQYDSVKQVQKIYDYIVKCADEQNK